MNPFTNWDTWEIKLDPVCKITPSSKQKKTQYKIKAITKQWFPGLYLGSTTCASKSMGRSIFASITKTHTPHTDIKSRRRSHLEVENTIPFALFDRGLLLLAFPWLPRHSRLSSDSTIHARDPDIEVLDVVNPIYKVKLIGFIRTVVGFGTRLARGPRAVSAFVSSLAFPAITRLSCKYPTRW